MTMRINLAVTNAISPQVAIATGVNKATIGIDAITARGGFGSAVVEIQWRAHEDDEERHWQSMVPVLTFDSTQTWRRKVSVTSCRAIRLKTTTADGSADSLAEVTMEIEA